MVAARGYSLATGIPGWRPLPCLCGIGSRRRPRFPGPAHWPRYSLGCRSRRISRSPLSMRGVPGDRNVGDAEAWQRIRAADSRGCVLPGLGAALVVSGYTVFHWPKGQLWYGATSLTQTFESITEASLLQSESAICGSRAVSRDEFPKPLLLPGLGVLCICQLVVTRIDGSWLHDTRARRLGRLGSALAAIVGVAILIQLAFVPVYWLIAADRIVRRSILFRWPR